MKFLMQAFLRYAALAVLGLGSYGTAHADLRACANTPLGCQWRIWAEAGFDEAAVVEGGFVEDANGAIVFDDPAKARAEDKGAVIVVSDFQATSDRSMSFSFSATSSVEGAQYFFQMFVPITTIAPPEIATLTLTLDYTLSSTRATGGDLGMDFGPTLAHVDNRTIDNDESTSPEAGGPCSTPTNQPVHCGHIVRSSILHLCVPTGFGTCEDNGRIATWVQMAMLGSFFLSPETSVVGTVFVTEVAAIPEASHLAMLVTGLCMIGWFSKHRGMYR